MLPGAMIPPEYTSSVTSHPRRHHHFVIVTVIVRCCLACYLACRLVLYPSVSTYQATVSSRLSDVPTSIPACGRWNASRLCYSLICRLRLYYQGTHMPTYTYTKRLFQWAGNRKDDETTTRMKLQQQTIDGIGALHHLSVYV